MRDLQIVTEICKRDFLAHGRVAQSVEQRIENPRVASSILAPATNILFAKLFNPILNKIR